MVEYVNLEDSKKSPNGKSRKKNSLYKFGKYSFSKTEIIHLIVAFVMILLTIIMYQLGFNVVIKIIGTSHFWYLFLIYFITIGLGFILHELAHKLVAQNYGFLSEFRADFTMLGFMFILSLFSPFILLAPGAVLILGRPTIKQNGIISIAGPLTNLSLAILFIILKLIFGNVLIAGISVFNIGISINAFLGIFNMLPFWVLDGKKVLNWSIKYYLLVMIPLVAIFASTFFNVF